MQEILKVQQKIVPEFLELLEKRYNILRTIYYNQPIGRRVLANTLGIGERIVRSEINFLKEQNLIEINTSGMIITNEGEIIIDKLKEFIHEIKGLSNVETFIKQKLAIKEIIVVPGNVDEDRTVINEIGKAAANYMINNIQDNNIIALTGGSTMKEVVDKVSKITTFKNVLVVPARGGMGKNVETQANTLAARLAHKIGANYKMLHLPDNLSENALSTVLNEKGIKEVIEKIYEADIILYGIGRADKMARRRGLNVNEIEELEKLGTVGEALGYYFNSAGKVVHSASTIGIKNEYLKKINTVVAVAGGKSKAEAIIATARNSHNEILITDEGAARQIVNLLS